MSTVAQPDDFEGRLANPPLIWAPRGPIQDMDADRQYIEKKVAGVVEEKDVRQGDYGPYPVLVVKLNDGRRVQVSGFETALKNQLAEHDPKIGERTGIVYLGLVESRRPGRKPYHNFRVVTDSSSREVSFAGLSTEGEDDATTEPPTGGEPDLPEPPNDSW